MSDRALVRSTDGPPDRRGESEDELTRLEAEIAIKRERVAASFGELRRRVHSATSWRHFAAAHPLAWIGAGLCLGFIVGSSGRQRRRAG